MSIDQLLPSMGPMKHSSPLEPTERSTVRRGRHRVVTDRGTLHQILTDGLVAHLGVLSGRHPVVLPVAYAFDPDGPDREGTLYVHGSVASRWLVDSMTHRVCVTVTELDGLVLAQRAFNHSMNYRCAVVSGVARRVDRPGELRRALDLIVDHSVPGRAATLEPASRKELAATAVFGVPLYEASVKVRSGGPGDSDAERVPGVWAGTVGLGRVADEPVSADYAESAALPAEVTARAAGWGAR